MCRAVALRVLHKSQRALLNERIATVPIGPNLLLLAETNGRTATPDYAWWVSRSRVHRSPFTAINRLTLDQISQIRLGAQWIVRVVARLNDTKAPKSGMTTKLKLWPLIRTWRWTTLDRSECAVSRASSVNNADLLECQLQGVALVRLV